MRLKASCGHIFTLGLALSGMLLACGDVAPQSGLADVDDSAQHAVSNALVELGSAQEPNAVMPNMARATDDDECDAIREKIQDDAVAMQGTQEYRALAKTPQFKSMTKTLRLMQKKHCKMKGIGPNAAVCKKLKSKVYKQQMALLHTPEFKALAATAEFKDFIRDAREGMMKGCLDDMKMGVETFISTAATKSL